MFSDNTQVQDYDSIISEEITNHPTWSRLKEQLNWYDTKSVICQRRYKILKTIQILFAVLIPILSFWNFEYANLITALAGASIALLEGLQHMNQYSTLWIIYRATAERLKHEKYLFLAAAGPYKELEEKERMLMLAERVEEHVSTEHANWFNETKCMLSEESQKRVVK